MGTILRCEQCREPVLARDASYEVCGPRGWAGPAYCQRAGCLAALAAVRLRVSLGDHDHDSHCTVDERTECCTVCHVVHGDPCSSCGGRGYYERRCPELADGPVCASCGGSGAGVTVPGAYAGGYGEAECAACNGTGRRP